MTRPPRTRRRRRPGWVPQQHGAWAMLAVPALTGLVLLARESGWRWAALPVVGVAFAGYLLLNAVTLWLRSRRAARYLPPVRAYAAVTALLGLLALLAAPGVVTWLVLVVPLVAVALVLASRRRDRALLSGAVTVLAACLLVPVLATLGPGPAEGRGATWWAFAVELAYFGGTVPYVKTMIRERGDRAWLVGSVAWHLVVLLGAVVTALLAPAGVAVPALWASTAVLALAAARAWLVPRTAAATARTPSPMQVGLLELALSVAVLVAVLL